MRTARTAVGLAALCLALVAVVPAATGRGGEGPTADASGCGSQQRFKPGKELPGRAPLAIGDSVLLGAGEEVAEFGFSVNARGCRGTDEGLDLLRRVTDAGKLPKVVVFALGSNDVVSRADLVSALRMLGRDRVLGLVTPVEIGGRGGPDAKVMRDLAACKPKRTVLIDWVRYSRRHPEATYDDRIHLTPEGQEAMARMYRRALPARLAERKIPKADC